MAAEGRAVAEEGGGCATDECERRPRTSCPRGRALVTPATSLLLRRMQRVEARAATVSECQSECPTAPLKSIPFY